ncbi:hypothetical protein MMC18_002403 [Xylographa bjoerkii]|nr:hypothetical protein [Xylographa bjoerkii]
MTTVAESLQSEGHVDPDAQATVTDFLDYTEYLPADLIRSLTLIGKLDESYLSSTTRIHDLLSTYGGLPHSPANKKQSPQVLRKEISYYLEHALNARESAYAESSRLYDEVDRHYNRLASVKSKLLALPKPPSRDPTPVPIQHSPQANRARLGRIGEGGDTPPPRITLRLNANGSRHHGGCHRPRHRIRRITIPGEVLPPPNPDSPPSMTDTDWESRSPSPIPMPTSRVGAPPRSRSIKLHHIKIPKTPKPPRMKVPKAPRPPRPPRPPGAMGTNVHSAVAGISTSNALSLLTPPPPDAKPGTVHAPWMRLTEWEMARLRKRMKKNAIWTPSETMIRRELSEAGRGPENYRKTRSRCEETGDEFLDCDNIATTAPGKQLVPGEISADSLGFESKLSNKGMKLNEAKKLKKELLAREQAAIAAAEAEQAAKRLGDIGSSFKNLFDKPGAAPLSAASSSSYAPHYGLEKPAVKPAKKRKLAPTLSTEETQIQAQLHSEIVLSPNKPALKKRKTAPPPTPANPTNTTTTTTIIPLAAPAPSPIKSAPPPVSPTIIKKPLPAATSSAAASRSRRPSLTLRGPAPLPEPTPSSRPPSRPSSRHVSTGPPPPSPPSREHLRRKSATPAPAPITTAASRRSKRPAPGPVTSSQDGGAAVSVGRRKNAPRKRGAAAAARKAAEGSAKEKEEEKSLEEEAPEEIDPDEPRYCLCGDVSFGTMICCENPDVSLPICLFAFYR